jgi:hypothetical protein
LVNGINGFRTLSHVKWKYSKIAMYNAGTPEVNGTEIPATNDSVPSDVPTTTYTSPLHPLAITGIASGSTFLAVVLSVVIFILCKRLCKKLKDRTKVSRKISILIK